MRVSSIVSGMATGAAVGAALSLAATGMAMLNPHVRRTAVQAARKAEHAIDRTADKLTNKLG